ncbi:hypothetical protein D3C84_879180 [compost metagenome]
MDRYASVQVDLVFLFELGDCFQPGQWIPLLEEVSQADFFHRIAVLLSHSAVDAFLRLLQGGGECDLLFAHEDTTWTAVEFTQGQHAADQLFG